jgi:hypothetical protein
MKGNGQAGITATGELLARRWKESRPYFMLQGTTRGVGLHSWWLRRHACGGFDLHWSRVSAAQLRAQRQLSLEVSERHWTSGNNSDFLALPFDQRRFHIPVPSSTSFQP